MGKRTSASVFSAFMSDKRYTSKCRDGFGKSRLHKNRLFRVIVNAGAAVAMRAASL
jgi:hypothetical protein